MKTYAGVAAKRVLITGATSGLGLAMAQALARAGASVALTGRDHHKIERALETVKASAGECIGALINVRDEESIRGGVAQVVEHWGGIDVLVNNAGIGMRTVNPEFLTKPQPFWDVPAAGFRELIDTNVTGYFLVAKHVVPHFLKAQSGRIINISMNHETMRRKGFVPYGPSRAATEALSQIMAADLAEYGITVNMLLPGGGTETGMIPEHVLANRASFESKSGFTLLSPDVMGEPIVFLCSDEAKNLSDERIVAKDFGTDTKR